MNQNNVLQTATDMFFSETSRMIGRVQQDTTLPLCWMGSLERIRNYILALQRLDNVSILCNQDSLIQLDPRLQVPPGDATMVQARFFS